MPIESKDLLNVSNLTTRFYTYEGIVNAVEGVNLQMSSGEVLGLLGETGCGKSVTAFSIMRLINPPGKITEGRILFMNEDLVRKTETEMQDIRGAKISMIFQEPMSSLNPLYKVGEQITDVIKRHQKIVGKDALEKTSEVLTMVRLTDPERVLNQYPFELSGGMQQRVMIAAAISCNARLLIADEPTTMLDVSIQAEIIELLARIVRERNTGLLLITHDLGVVAQLCQKVAVMYLGNIVEYSGVRELFKNPAHPYTIGLLNSIPSTEGEIKRLNAIEGDVPDSIHPPTGCRFHPRCKLAREICRMQRPVPIEIGQGHIVYCFEYGETSQTKS